MTPSVLIAYSHNGMVHEVFLRSLRQVDIPSVGFKGIHVAWQRNLCVARFLDTEHEWLWFIDTDVQFDPDVCPRLLKHADPERAPIVCAAYNLFYEIQAGIHLAWWRFSEERGFTSLQKPEGDFTRLDACGLGCTLIHRSALLRMKGDANITQTRPWFGYDEIRLLDGQVRLLPEDQTFCWRAGQQGIPIRGANVRVGHHKVVPL